MSRGILLALAAVVILLIGGCNSYNSMNSLKQGVDKSWADVQNVYQVMILS